MKTTLQISSGRGPVEVRRFVRLLAEHLGARLGVAPRLVGDHDAPLSAVFEVDPQTAEGWVGTHELRAPLRGARRRQRWFVQVTAFDQDPERAAPQVRLQATRAGGPGGQNVNKRATAVRAVDRVSGLAVRVCEQRSQAQNRALAEARLRARLEARGEAAAAQGRANRRAAHDAVVRGDARFRWRLSSGGELVGGE